MPLLQLMLSFQALDRFFFLQLLFLGYFPIFPLKSDYMNIFNQVRHFSSCPRTFLQLTSITFGFSSHLLSFFISHTSLEKNFKISFSLRKFLGLCILIFSFMANIFALELGMLPCATSDVVCYGPWPMYLLFYAYMFCWLHVYFCFVWVFGYPCIYFL